MYNRYVPQTQTYAPLREEGQTEGRERQSSGSSKYKQGPAGTQGGFGNFEKLFSPGSLLHSLHPDSFRSLLDRDKFGGLDSLLSALNLEGLDSGDILLILIILLLLVEGDNLELVITLGLMLILSLGDTKKDPDREDLSGSED